jgi:hypothetical protein
MKKHIVVLTGAGISAEGGLDWTPFGRLTVWWTQHRIEDVATILKSSEVVGSPSPAIGNCLFNRSIFAPSMCI